MSFGIKTSLPCLLAAALTSASHAAAMLPALNIDKTTISVSGLSSGGFMAIQLGYAHSDTFKGVGVFAGGPYMCAGHSNYTACMYNARISASQLSTLQADINAWSGISIDTQANVASQKLFLFVGTSDTTVGPNPMDAVNTQYTNNGAAAANLQYVKRASTAHVFPTDFDATGNKSCSSAISPYIGNCGYDGAKAVLSQVYGTLDARNNAPAAANYIEFDQPPYSAGNLGMAATGWIYVPTACAGGAAQCRLHVALHGCQQSYGNIGDKFIKNTGYTRWADTNKIVVLFPQARVDNTSHSTVASGSLANPNACWDWVGWYGADFARKSGVQVTAIKAMVDRVASGSVDGSGGGTLPAPTGVTTSGATATTMVVSWGAVTMASGYNVYRGGAIANNTWVTATSFTDTGLAAGATYSWNVRALDAAGVEGATSAAATGTTTGSAPVCVTSSNYAHTTASRATQSGGYTYAKGSNQNMGLWNTFTTSTLKQTGPSYYVIGTCP